MCKLLLGNGEEVASEQKRTVALGMALLLCLALAYVENAHFVRYLRGQALRKSLR